MKKTVLWFVLLAGLSINSLIAQSLSQAEKRMLYMDVLSAINSYEEYSPISDNQTQRRFIGLFDDPEMLIFNDLFGISGAENISVKEYADLMVHETVAPTVHIKNITHGAIHSVGNMWMVEVKLEKSLEYTNTCDVLFSSKNHFNSDFHLTLTYLWDMQTRDCKIHALDGHMESDSDPLPDKFVIFTHTDSRDDDLLFDDKKISFNYFHQTFFPGTFEDVKTKLTYPKDDDMRCVLVYDEGKEECNMVKMTYTPKHWRVRPHIDFSMGQSLSDETTWDLNKHSSSIDFGIDLGYMFPSGKKLRSGLFSGLAFSKGKLKLENKNLAYYYDAAKDADVDADEYVRYYNISNLQYRVSTADIYVPIYLDLSFGITDMLSAYMDLGGKVYINLKNTVTRFSARYSTYGLFPQYDNLYLFGNSFDDLPANDPEHFTIDGFVTDGTLGLSNLQDRTVPYTGLLSADAFGAVGLRVKVMTDLFVEMGLNYQRNILSDVLGKPQNVTENIAAKYPVCYSVAVGEQVYSPIFFFDKLYRNSWKLNMGVIYRF